MVCKQAYHSTRGFIPPEEVEKRDGKLVDKQTGLLVELSLEKMSKSKYNVVPPDALVAAHDIGAIGYFARRPLLDLAGLVTPEVIPFIRDEPLLLAFILDREAAYVVTFPSWYPEMIAWMRKIFPHWTIDRFDTFCNKEAKLPFDQNCVVALVAPRPILMFCGKDDYESNPEGAQLPRSYESP